MAIVAACASRLPAEDAKPEAPKKIGTAEAIKHYDEELAVTGKVAQVTVRPTIVYLNLDKAFPDSPFTAVIFARSTNGFGDLSKLKGKDVEVNGKIAKYHDKPQIVLESTNQLKVIEAKAAPETSEKK
jgi:DNA/RNA endonuclease YhcR with UshA esterase domain